MTRPDPDAPMNKKLLPLAVLGFSTDHSVTGITRFQKLVFLAQNETVDETPYEFTPGSYGPYSTPLHEDITLLARRNFISERKERLSPHTKQNTSIYELTEKGERALVRSLATDDPDIPQEAFDEIIPKYSEMSLWDLLEYVYAEYPNMAANSNLPF